MSGGLLVAKGDKGNKGDKGDAYVITDADKQEIKEALSTDISELKGDLANVKRPYVFPNLYDSSELIDGKLVNNSMGYNCIVTYANGILSGHVPVNEEETYTVKTDSFGIGALFFFQKESDGRYKCICAEERLSTGAYGSWTGITGLVEDMKHSIKERCFKILPNSNITHVLWYITNSDSTNNYFGVHTETDINRIKKDVRMFRGTVDYGFHEYRVGILTEDSILGQKNINDYVRREIGGDKPVTYSLNGDDIVLTSEVDGNVWVVESTKNNPLSGVYKLGWVKKNGVNYKNMGDDIAPFFCDNSYIGSSHGESVGYKLTSVGHGKTEQDIGSTYSNNGKEFIILYIIDENTLMMLGEVVPNNQYYEYRFYASSMTGDTLTHVSGGTNTSDIVFSEQTRQVQILPYLKNLSISCKADDREVSDGVGTCRKFTIQESYDIIDLVKVRSFLVQNVGNNTNSSYYDSSVDSEIRVTQEVTFDEKLSISVKSYCTLLRDSSGARYGVIQAEAFPVANRLTYVPFTNMDTPIKQTGELRIATWNNENTPPHKYYQFNPSMTEGWIVGYDVSYGNSNDSTRKGNLKTTGGQINEYTSKMYPYIFENLTDKHYIGETIGGVAYCGAVRIVDNSCTFIHNAGDHLIVEIEAFDTHSIDSVLINGYENASVTVLKSDGGIRLINDAVVNGKVKWMATSKGSITLLIS